MAALAVSGKQVGRLVDGLSGKAPAPAEIRSPFASFGPLAAQAKRQELGPAADSLLERMAQAATFTVAEARRRLSDFLSGSFAPSSASDFVAYLKTNLLGLEKRTYGNNSSSYHVVDALSRQSVPAALVDARKLNDKSIDRVLGRNPEADRRLQQEAVAAQRYRAKMSPFLRQATEKKGVPFTDWGNMGFTLGASLSGAAYVVRNGEGYIGTQIGTCAETPEQTRAMLRTKSAELSQQLGRKVQFVFDQNMTPGSPILLADEKLARARNVDPALAADRLAKTFGMSLNDHFQKMAQSAAPSAAAETTVVSLDEFRARFARKAEAPEPVVERGTGFGYDTPSAPPMPENRRIVVQYDEHGRSTIWDNARNQEYREARSFHMLPQGEYTKEDAVGMPFGRIRVDQDGHVTHLTLDDREHNLDGPSFEPAPDSNLPKRWAIEGQNFNNFSDFKAQRDYAMAPAAEPAPAPAASEADSGGLKLKLSYKPS